LTRWHVVGLTHGLLFLIKEKNEMTGDNHCSLPLIIKTKLAKKTKLTKIDKIMT